MKATGEIQVVPIGSGVSVRSEVRRAHAILEASDLRVELHGNGTNVEGELDEVLAAVRRIHEALHAEGTVRLTAFVKIGTRTDKEPSLQAKVEAVA
ncbi:MAG TPA: MTH1187 family thiamine-binding protein [Longimicrobiales bacterium]|nr:MTH1187 family thiamine-binding protein [Longimicrobiales bacterium]